MSDPVLSPAHAPAPVRDAIARRVDLMRRKRPAEAHGPGPKWLFREPLAFFEPVTRPFRRTAALPRAEHPRVVMLLPGFGTHPLRMRRMARELERAGHRVKRWGLGFNLGPTEENFALLERRVQQIAERYGQPVVLVGWSLG